MGLAWVTAIMAKWETITQKNEQKLQRIKKNNRSLYLQVHAMVESIWFL